MIFTKYSTFSSAYLTKQVLFAEFVANIGPKFSSIIAYMVQGLGASLQETIAQGYLTIIRIGPVR